MKPSKKGTLFARLSVLAILALALGPFGAMAAPVQAPAAAPAAAPAPLFAGPPVMIPSGVPGVRAAVLVPAQASAPDACPATPAGFDTVINREPRFCLYYLASSITAAQATTAADHVTSYWDRYTSLPDFNFREPNHTAGTPLMVIMTVDSGCNGSTGFPPANSMNAFTGCFGTTESIQKVLGHELFHRVQFSYDPAEALWFIEGTARTTEDLAFTNIDHWATCLTAVSSSFGKQVNTYLSGTNADITSDPMRYNSALWWKYFTEKYGSILTEPQRGIDAMRTLWEQAETHDDIAAVNAALSALGAGVDFNTAFRRFVVANYTKDLSGLPDNSYNYLDEEEVGNCATFGPIVPATKGTVSPGTPRSWTSPGDAVDVTRYGVRYFQAPVDASCKVVSATFHKNSGADAFFQVVTQKGTVFAAHREGNGTDWTQSFVNDGLTKITAITGGQDNPGNVNVSFTCTDPVIDVKLPNDVAVAHVGPAGTPGKFLVQVLVTNGSPTGPVVAGLTNSDFKVRVNGINALISAGGFIQEQYWLLVQAPAQTANGTFDLQVDLEAPSSSTVVATDTNTASVHYDADATDQVLVIDRSGSMGWGSSPRLPAAQSAAKLYVDVGRNGDGLAVVAYSTDVTLPVFAMQATNNTVRTNAKNYIDALTATFATSIGDGLHEAVNQRSTSPTGNPRCSFVLLSDGMENSPLFWADVQAEVQASGCPVTSIAFGPESNETLMQNIATATGGLYFYNDVFVSAPPTFAGPTAQAMLQAGLAPEIISQSQMDLDLSNTYEYAEANGEHRQRILDEEGVISRSETITREINIDDSISEALFTLDWPARTFATLVMALVMPDGTPVNPQILPAGGSFFADFAGGDYIGYRIPNPMPGTWKAVVTYVTGEISPTPYQLLVSGRTFRTLTPFLPDLIGRRFGTGNRIPILAFYTDNLGPILGANISATVTGPDNITNLLPLFDDGKHGDGAANDGIYGGFFSRSNQASPVPIQPGTEPGTPPIPLDEGSYRVGFEALGGGVTREAMGGFAIEEGPDANGNGMPDTFEAEYGVTDPADDPDLDGLANLDEYNAGTDPTNSDSDGSGENDGSEVTVLAANAPTAATDPLNPDDDRIEAPEFFNTQPGTGLVTLTFDTKPGYVAMVLYRSTQPDSGFNLVAQDIPPTGEYVDQDVTNETTYYYKIYATDNADFAAAHKSAVLDGDAVKPSVDPVPPLAQVFIDGGAPSTKNIGVTLTFGPYEDAEALAAFSDISEMMLSNDPTFAGAVWQPFQQDVPWSLHLPKKGEVAHVYARFKDAHGNESVTPEVGSILFDASYLFLPFNQFTP